MPMLSSFITEAITAVARWHTVWAVVAACALVMGGAGCGGSKEALSEAEMQKLTPPLQQVVQGNTPSGPQQLQTQTRADGTVAYLVLLRVTDADAVREAGIPVNSVQGPVATARLSADELRRAAKVDAVTRIEASQQTFPTQ